MEFLVNTRLPTMLTRQGARGQTIGMLAGREDRWGRKITPVQAAGRWLGINIISVSPEQTRAITEVRAQDLRKEMYRVKNDPCKSEAAKAAAEAGYREKIAELAGEAPAAILPIKKKPGNEVVFAALIEMERQGILRTGPPSRSIEIGGILATLTMELYREYLGKSSDVIHRRMEPLVISEK